MLCWKRMAASPSYQSKTNGVARRKVYKALLWIRGGYTFLTALWGLVDIDSFMVITGPKTDIWLVKTVTVLLLPISLCFFYALFFKTDERLISILGMLTSLALACIDFYYTANKTIRWVYAVDGVLEMIFCIAWIYVLVKSK
jgi:hypothetical protein